MRAKWQLARGAKSADKSSGVRVGHKNNLCKFKKTRRNTVLINLDENGKQAPTSGRVSRAGRLGVRIIIYLNINYKCMEIFRFFKR
jgi:hypothetical protein